MLWISTDKAIPAYDEQLVKIKVVALPQGYTTEGWYDHDRQEWYSVEGYCLHDNVYAWKHMRPIKTLNPKEREIRISKWQ